LTTAGTFSTLVKKYDNIGLVIDPLFVSRLYFGKYLAGKKIMFFYGIYTTSGTYSWTDFNYTLSGATVNNVLTNGTANTLEFPFSSGAITGITAGPSLLIALSINSVNDYIELSGGIQGKAEFFCWVYN